MVRVWWLTRDLDKFRAKKRKASNEPKASEHFVSNYIPPRSLPNIFQMAKERSEKSEKKERKEKKEKRSETDGVKKSKKEKKDKKGKFSLSCTSIFRTKY